MVERPAWTALLGAPRHAFDRARDAPDAPGVYVVWHGPALLYAGMAGRLRARLRAHASGRRSGDQFCVYVCDRFVVPALTPGEQAACGAGTLRLDARTRAFIHAALQVTWYETPTVADARAAERALRQGAFGPLPSLNPLTA